ncbi:hypothetical protein [Actinocorallia lasiicapitis]
MTEVLVAGPASARSAEVGVEDVVEVGGAISGAELPAFAAKAGVRYSAREAAAIKKYPCRWVERKRGRRVIKRNGAKGRWLIWIKVRLHWCYDEYDAISVMSSKGTYTYYTSNKRVWRWRGWAEKKLNEKGGSSGVSSVTAIGQGKFYYTGNRTTYRPYIWILGGFDGSYKTGQCC